MCLSLVVVLVVLVSVLWHLVSVSVVGLFA